MFYCNPWTQHLMAECDPSREDMITADHPNNRWWPFTFRHRGALSDVTYGTEEQYLAGSSARWINHLGLNDYVHQESETPLADGLAGNLATVIALIAFSCRRSDWHDILMHDRAWWNYRWRGHNRRHGRELTSRDNLIRFSVCWLIYNRNWTARFGSNSVLRPWKYSRINQGQLICNRMEWTTTSCLRAITKILYAECHSKSGTGIIYFWPSPPLLREICLRTKLHTFEAVWGHYTLLEHL
jgi:hypothetical protein